MVDRRFVTAFLAVLAALLAAAATQGLVLAAVAVVVALGCTLLAILGRERTAILAFSLAFATAPMYRGLLPELPASPTDLLLLVGVLLLLPELLVRQARIPALFLVSLGALFILGLRGALVNEAPIASLALLVQWMIVLAVFPVVVALWRPAPPIVGILLWSYLAGHMVSVLVALAEGPLVNNRYDGLTHHANAFGTSGAVSVAIVLYLWTKHRTQMARVVLAGILLASGASILMSGSRAATVVVVALVLLVPAVERSVLLVAGVAGAGAVGVSFFPYVVEASAPGSSIRRLVGDGTARASDSVRDDAIEQGWQQFHSSPLFGSGMSIQIAEVHNLYLEVAIAVGIFGLIAYLGLLYVLARPLLSDHPQRRLSYFAWIFAIIGPVVPGLTDRSMLLPMGLAILGAIAVSADDDGPPATRAVSSSRKGSTP